MENRIKDYSAREGSRVFAAIHRAIRAHTLLVEDEAEELARAVADMHVGWIARLVNPPAVEGSTSQR